MKRLVLVSSLKGGGEGWGGQGSSRGNHLHHAGVARKIVQVPWVAARNDIPNILLMKSFDALTGDQMPAASSMGSAHRAPTNAHGQEQGSC